MASQLTQYRVFIASPGGLEKERSIFRNTINCHNDADGNPRGVTFFPVGWEITLRGVGRPQETINQEVSESDYFVLILWDRWGTPPDTGGRFSSGTEEEFQIALDCYNDPAHPLRDIIILFKTVDPRQLSDPGEQLQKVLDFRKTLESDKKIFYDTFDNDESLAEKLRKYLSSWTRNHEEASATSQTKVNHRLEDEPLKVDSLFTTFETKEPQPSSFIRETESFLKQGRLTDAEARLVNAIMPGDDMSAFRTYGQFLVKSGRLTDAESVYAKMRDIAIDTKEKSWEGAALGGLAGIYRLQKNYTLASNTLTQAYDLKESVGDERGMMEISVWHGDLCAQTSKWNKAKHHYEIASKLFNDTQPTHFLLTILEKLTKAAYKDNDLSLATKSERQTGSVRQSLDDIEHIKKIKSLQPKRKTKSNKT